MTKYLVFASLVEHLHLLVEADSGKFVSRGSELGIDWSLFGGQYWLLRGLKHLGSNTIHYLLPDRGISTFNNIGRFIMSHFICWRTVLWNRVSYSVMILLRWRSHYWRMGANTFSQPKIGRSSCWHLSIKWCVSMASIFNSWFLGHCRLTIPSRLRFL